MPSSIKLPEPDLLSLVKLKLLQQRKAGRALVFVAPKDLESRLRSKGK
jgi:hypothetical protein